MKHIHNKATITLKMDGDKFTGQLEGTKQDLIHLIVHLVEGNKNFEDILLGAVQLMATARIAEILVEKEMEEKLKKGKEVKN